MLRKYKSSMVNRLKRYFLLVLAFVLSITIVQMQPGSPYLKISEATGNSSLTILEIQPTENYELTASVLSQHGVENAELIQMSMPEFISKVDEVNGKYDIIYIGNKIVENITYSKYGSRYPANKNLPQGGKTDSVEYYSEVDITNLKAAKIRDYIHSGQLIIFDASIFEGDSKLKDNFISYTQNQEQYPNVIIVENILQNEDTDSQKHLTVEYYNGKNFQELKFTTKEPLINHNWGSGSPDRNLLENDQFSVRWTGKIVSNDSGEHRIYATSDDGVRVWINNQKIIDAWSDHGSTTYSGDVILAAGQPYDFKVEYYENSGSASIKLEWAKKDHHGQYKNLSIIPASSFYSSDEGSNEADFFTIASAYEAAKKRPKLILISQPKEYNGTEASYETSHMLSFGFNAQNTNSNGPMTAKLFIDINGDGLFKGNELVETKLNVANEGNAINYRLPDSFTGIQPWKLELIDNATGAKSYEKGYAAFKGKPLVVRVLQLTPPGNTYSISRIDPSLMTKSGEYEIVVSEMPIAEFDKNYPNPYHNIPTYLNGNYDMIILGFADIYGGGNLTRDAAIQGVKDFIATGQSVMFTHDTMTFRVNDTGGWGYYLTRDFRDIIGQNRYISDPVPQPGSKSYGFTRLTLDRAQTNSFPTATTTHKLNEGIITQYPFVLNDTLNVATTHHQYFQLNLEDEEVIPWFTLKGNNRFKPYDGRNDYYTYTKGNITYSGTGHSSPNVTTEHKFFVNTMIKASRGANHAPTVEVFGISNNQNISPSNTRLNFSFVATDIDLDDRVLTGYVYLNDTLVGTYSTTSGSEVNVSVNKNNYISSEDTEFVVKVVAIDNSGAEGNKTINLTHRAEPSLLLSTAHSAGYLVGDTADISYVVSMEDQEGVSLEVEDINLRVILPSDTFSTEGSNDEWTTSGNIVNTYLTMEDTKRTLSLNLLRAGSHTLSSSLTYTVSGQDKGATDASRIDVKSGSIDVEVRNQYDSAIPNAGITIKDADTDAIVATGVTNTTGLFTKINLPSGNYKILLNDPQDYPNISVTERTVTLSYDEPSKKVVFGGGILVPEYFKNTGGDSEDRAAIVPYGSIRTNIAFTLNRDVKTVEIDLDTSINNISIRSIELYKNSVDGILIGTGSYSGGRIILPNDLEKGFYVCKLVVNVGADVDIGDLLDVAVDQYNVEEQIITTEVQEDGSEVDIINIIPHTIMVDDQMLEVLIVDPPKLI